MKTILFLSAMILGAGLAQATSNFECKAAGVPRVVTLEYSEPVSATDSQQMVYLVGTESTTTSSSDLLEACETAKAGLGELVKEDSTVHCSYRNGIKQIVFTTKVFSVSSLGAAALSLKGGNNWSQQLEFVPVEASNGAEPKAPFGRIFDDSDNTCRDSK